MRELKTIMKFCQREFVPHENYSELGKYSEGWFPVRIHYFDDGREMQEVYRSRPVSQDEVDAYFHNNELPEVDWEN